MQLSDKFSEFDVLSGCGTSAADGATGGGAPQAWPGTNAGALKLGTKAGASGLNPRPLSISERAGSVRDERGNIHER